MTPLVRPRQASPMRTGIQAGPSVNRAKGLDEPKPRGWSMNHNLFPRAAVPWRSPLI